MSNPNSTILANDYTTNNNKVICEAINCYREATEKIDIKAGSFGLITLNLCKRCIKRFQKSRY